MAIPFAMPEEDNEVELLIRELDLLCLLLKTVVRQITERNRIDLTQTVRNPTGHQNGAGGIGNMMNSRLIVGNCGNSSTAEFDVSSRRRTISESSCCDDTKAAISRIENADWDQDDADEPETRHSTKPGFLSGLVPDTFRCTLWTAVPVICVIGWHLLRAR